MPEETEVGGLVARDEGIEKYKLVVTDSHGGVKYSTGNTVSSVVIIVYSARWVLEIWGRKLYRVYDCRTTKHVHLELIQNNIEHKL